MLEMKFAPEIPVVCLVRGAKLSDLCLGWFSRDDPHQEWFLRACFLPRALPSPFTVAMRC